MDRMISVIVCTYNQQDSIGETLDSILTQKTTLPIEIVVGEDCSTDKTRQVCRQYRERYPDIIRLVENKRNKGLMDNYFDCLMQCRGMYVADCAGDDRWTDELKLEKEAKILDRYQDVGIVHTNWQFRNREDGSTWASPPPKRKDFISDGQEYLEDILVQTYRPAIHLCTSMYRADWAKEEHDAHPEFFRNRTYPCEDVQLAYFLAARGKVAYIDEVTLDYSWGGESISNPKNHARQFDFCLRTTQLSYDLASRHGKTSKLLQEFFSMRAAALMMHAFRAYDKQLRLTSISAARKWNVPTNAWMNTIKLATSNPVTWKSALVLRKIVVTLKHIL